MANIYKELKEARNGIDKIFAKLSNGEIEKLNYEELFYSWCMTYSISEKKIGEIAEMAIKHYGLKIADGEITK